MIEWINKFEICSTELRNADQGLGIVTKTSLPYPGMLHFNNISVFSRQTAKSSSSHPLDF